MINLVYIVLFVFCLAIAVAGVLVCFQLTQNYTTTFHKNYLYYLITFYAFALYGIWGQLIVRSLLAEMDSSVRIIETIANFLPILGLPFLFVSWIMLINMGYAMFELKAGKQWMIFHIILFLTLIVGVWFGYEYLNEKARFSHQLVKYFGVGIISLMDLVYFLAFIIVVFYISKGKQIIGKKWLIRFSVLLVAVLLFRSLIIPLSFLNSWLLAFVILLYFGSNLIPLMYMRWNADYIFQPIKAEETSEEGIDVLLSKYRITKREKEIVMEICSGKTNQQIADDLFISLQTVKDHTHRIYSKLGINSRMKLVQLVNG